MILVKQVVSCCFEATVLSPTPPQANKIFSIDDIGKYRMEFYYFKVRKKKKCFKFCYIQKKPRETVTAVTTKSVELNERNVSGV